MALTTPSATREQLAARAAELLPELARGAAGRERDRILPFDEIDRISAVGLVALRVPRAYGGPGGSVRDLIRFVIDLAAVDSNIAQALRPGYLNVENLLESTDDRERELWFPRLLRGEFVGNAGWERGGASGEVRTRIVSAGDHFLVNGVKSYSTGALFASWVTTTALDEAGELVSFTVPRDRDGLHLIDDWDGSGQRLTASGTTELVDLVVYRDEIRAAAPRRGRSVETAVAQLFLAAVLAGIARNALTDAVAYANDHARPIVHSLAARSVDDPYVQHAVGEISARAYAADAAVIRAAEAIDRATAGGEIDPGRVPRADAADQRPAPAAADPALLTAASIEVAQAQFIAAESALRAGETLFEVGGASTTLRTHNLDRHWRNARTVANHNPRAYKASVVGAHQLTGAEPPTSGLF